MSDRRHTGENRFGTGMLTGVFDAGAAGAAPGAAAGGFTPLSREPRARGPSVLDRLRTGFISEDTAKHR